MKRRIWKWALAMVLGLCSIGMFFLPQMTFIFEQSRYRASGLELIFAQGFSVESGSLLAIPFVLRVTVFLGMLAAVAGVVLLWRWKTSWAALCFLLTGVSPLAALVSSASLPGAVQYRIPFLVVLAAGVSGAVLSLWTQGADPLARLVFRTASCVSIGAVLMLTIYIFASGIPAIVEVGGLRFFFGTHWDAGEGEFGILPFFLSSLAATGGAILAGVPVGVLTAVFLSEVAGKRAANWMRPAVELLAGIPSVVYGFFGMLTVVPAIRWVFGGATIGDSLLAAIIILAIMVIPTIVNVTEQSLRAVPRAYREASLALGATPMDTIFRVTLPAARRGILSGVILGVGRAVGETMAVMMVAGNVAQFPRLLGSVRLLTTGVAMEMSYAAGLHRQALFAIGLVLFLFIMAVNISFTVLSRKGAQAYGN